MNPMCKDDYNFLNSNNPDKQVINLYKLPRFFVESRNDEVVCFASLRPPILSLQTQ
ncbi:hypothetical protein [Helicobacter rodentium]|uniref:hypothetical protein n=1 Tax=Helicobacter rodentium TaxID=59617 RepID=UPI0025581DDE|nr:hypothetical protein [Helicobacter rodentium]